MFTGSRINKKIKKKITEKRLADSHYNEPEELWWTTLFSGNYVTPNRRPLAVQCSVVLKKYPKNFNLTKMYI